MANETEDSDESGVVSAAFPPGHFYSPVVDPGDIELRRDRIWPENPQCLGIDFNDAGHRRLLVDVFPRYLHEYDYKKEEEEQEESGQRQYFSGNPAFGWLDSRALFALLRHWRPERLIEVGSGYSTLLISDVNTRFLGGSMEVTSVEPYPAEFLREPIDGLTRLVEARVEDIPPTEFEVLRPGDVLFIDSSHVAKTGSDVNFLFFEVLPRLSPGVRIHVHDAFLPYDYPPEWVLGENRSWNEQYLLRAFLMYSTVFRVVFGSTYAAARFPELVAAALPGGQMLAGGSFWIERIDG